MRLLSHGKREVPVQNAPTLLTGPFQSRGCSGVWHIEVFLGKEQYVYTGRITVGIGSTHDIGIASRDIRFQQTRSRSRCVIYTDNISVFLRELSFRPLTPSLIAIAPCFSRPLPRFPLCPHLATDHQFTEDFHQCQQQGNRGWVL